MTTQAQTNGTTDFNCNGDHWYICYFTADTSYHSHGQHTGEITGKAITLEYFDTEAEMLSKISDLGITIPEPE
jgi:hypothetical protein